MTLKYTIELPISTFGSSVDVDVPHSSTDDFYSWFRKVTESPPAPYTRNLWLKGTDEASGMYEDGRVVCELNGKNYEMIWYEGEVPGVLSAGDYVFEGVHPLSFRLDAKS